MCAIIQNILRFLDMNLELDMNIIRKTYKLHFLAGPTWKLFGVFSHNFFIGHWDLSRLASFRIEKVKLI